MKRYASAVFMALFLILSLAGAVAVEGTWKGGPDGAGSDLNVSGVDIANQTLPPDYKVTPAPIEVKVEITGTALPGPKGEMAAGPRSIGFSTDIISLLILGGVIIVVSAGAWYLLKRKPEEPGREPDEAEDK